MTFWSAWLPHRGDRATAIEAIGAGPRAQARSDLDGHPIAGGLGLEVTKWLKADDELKSIPVVAVTAFAMKGDEERIRAGGCEAYLSKPISSPNSWRRSANMRAPDSRELISPHIALPLRASGKRVLAAPLRPRARHNLRGAQVRRISWVRGVRPAADAFREASPRVPAGHPLP